MQEREPQPEKQPTPLSQNPWVIGGGTFLAAGAIDLIAHAGPPGLLVGGLLALVVGRHGPEILDRVKSILPPPREADTEEPDQHVWAERPGRSFLDRALGRNLATETGVLVLEEGSRTPAATQQVYAARDPHLSLALGPNFTPDVNMLLGEGVFATGVKGSGKSGVMAVFIEQIGTFGVPMVVFDKEGDFLSLREVLPQCRVADQDNWYSAADIIEQELQVVVDLGSWLRDEDRAQAMVSLATDLIEYTSAQAPEERKPCPIFLDEAQHWLPEDGCNHFTKETQLELTDAFNILLSTGRKRGLTPFIFTQRIAAVKKSVIALGIQIFLRQVTDVDKKRCMEYVSSDLIEKHALAALETGQGVVCLPGGYQLLVSFYRRSSRHVSHTPGVERVGRHAPPTRKMTEQTAQQPPRYLATLPVSHTGPARLPAPPPLTELQQLVLDVWEQQPGKRTHREIAAFLSLGGNDVSPSSVYNTLIVLETRGLIERPTKKAVEA